MEFIKIKDDRYIIKGSNSFIVNEKEKLKLEKKELVLNDIKSDNCQKETTLKIKEIDDKLNGKTKSKTIKETTTSTE